MSRSAKNLQERVPYNLNSLLSIKKSLSSIQNEIEILCSNEKKKNKIRSPGVLPSWAVFHQFCPFWGSS